LSANAEATKERIMIMKKINSKKYGAVIIDPPWDIDQKGARGAVMHYDLMTLDQIKAMPISDLTEPDAHCWLWVMNGTLRHGYDVLEAWGFTPRSVFTWVKPRLGLGNYLRNATEHVLRGTRGKAPVLYRAQPNWGFFPIQDHSHKPEEFHEIVKRVSPGPYLELFARRRYPGFDVWGNEIDSDISIPGYPVPSDHRRKA
jgi:N6-adenosine-specific RNA methylase IME4